MNFNCPKLFLWSNILISHCRYTGILCSAWGQTKKWAWLCVAALPVQVLVENVAKVYYVTFAEYHNLILQFREDKISVFAHPGNEAMRQSSNLDIVHKKKQKLKIATFILTFGVRLCPILSNMTEIHEGSCGLMGMRCIPQLRGTGCLPWFLSERRVRC